MHSAISSIIVDEKKIAEVCQSLGQKITRDYQGKSLLVVGLLKGSIPFFADLIKHIELDIEIDFMDLSSYSGTNSTHEVKVLKDLESSVIDRDVLIVEDIFDTGYTLEKVLFLLSYRKAKSIEVVALLNKLEVTKVAPAPKYVGIEIPNEFVVGYGLDYNEKYRNLPYIGILKKEMYS